MVQVTRPIRDQRTVVPRDTTVASVWRDLNRIGLKIGVVAGAAAAASYAILLLTTGDAAFVLSGLLSTAVMLAGLVGLRAREPDLEILLVVAALAAISATSIATPIGRGGLWAAVAVLATVGTAAGVAIVRVAKTALDRSEATRIAIFRSVPVGLFRCAPNGEIIDANPALAEMLRFDEPSDLFGIDITDLHESPKDWEEFAATLESSHSPQRFAHRMRASDGSILWVRGFAQAVISDHDEVVYLEGSIEDVTQRREVEESARLHADRFRSVFEHAPIALWEEDYTKVGARLDDLRRQGVTDLRAHLEAHPEEAVDLIGMVEYLDVNPAGVALLGAASKKEALANMRPGDMPADVVEGFIDEFVAIWEDRDSITIEIRGATMDGRGTDLALSWAVGRTPEGGLDLSRVIVALQDIGMIKQAERDLAALVESKDDLVASVSHELRTPITTILGMAFELRDHGDDFNRSETRELVEIIADQSRELSNIVEDLLVAAWSDSDALTVRAEIVNVTTELNRIVPTGPRAPRVEVERPVLAWVDPLRLRQILRNLLTNAVKYGGPSVVVTAEARGETVVIEVKDDGPGVPEADRARIFDPYVRSQEDLALPGSLGLGLPVSRRLARVMGGDLQYRYDDGSVFELTLPAPVRGHFL